MRRTPLLLLSTLLLLATLVFAWPEPPAPGGPATTPRANGAETAASGADALPTDAPPALPPEGADAAPGHREVVLATEPMAMVRVVEFGSGRPVPGATVRHLLPLDGSQLSQESRDLFARLADDDPEELLERFGEATTTDEEGRCEIPMRPGGTQVTARRGDWFGVDWLAPTVAGEQRVTVRRDRTLLVRVVDAANRPAADVEVGATLGTDWSMPIGRTDGAGRLRWLHCQKYLRGDQASLTCELRASVVGVHSSSATVDLADPVPEVVLRLPATGTVTVFVAEADGSPVDTTFVHNPAVVLSAHDRPPASPYHDAQERLGPPGGAPIDAHGNAHFPRVALDTLLVASFGGRTVQFAGPTRERPHVTATLQADPGAVVVTGRLLGPGGEPLPVGDVVLHVRRTAGGQGFSTQRTDAQGRFRIPMGSALAGREASLTLRRPRTALEDPGSGLACDLPPRRLHAGVQDLGDVQLEAARVLLAGHVVRSGPCGEREPPLSFEQRIGDRWTRVAELQNAVRWPERDRFEVLGVLPPDTPLCVQVGEGDWMPVAPIECRVGATDLRIELRAGGSVEATFLLDGATSSRLLYRLQPSRPHAGQLDELLQSFFTTDTTPDAMLRRSWTGLPPGDYSLAVLCSGIEPPLVRIDALRVVDGPCADPRLAAIDLRGRVASVRIRAEDATGTAVGDPRAFVLPVAGAGTWRTFPLGDGVVELAVPGAIDVLVVAPGHRAERLALVVGEAVARLAPAHAARFAVQLPTPLPAGARLALRCEPQALGPPFADGSGPLLELDGPRCSALRTVFDETILVGADGAASMPVRAPGRYRLTAVLDDRHPLRVSPAAVELTADGGTFALTLDAAAWQRALAGR